MIKGKDVIIIDSNGNAVVAAAKSCDINIQADTFEMSSTTSGAWRKYITGRKGWTVNISHLVLGLVQNVQMVGTNLTIKLSINADNAFSFNGFVNNVTLSQGTYSGIPQSIYWDKTRKIFVGYVTPSSGVTLYFASWIGSTGYSSPSPFSVFNYNNVSYTWYNSNLTKERLSGNVIVTSWHPVATVGNLANGQFSFLGNGPLEAESIT